MPNHCHLILEGEADDSDLWATVVEFKQHTGFWFRTNSPHIRWQKDFYDHIIRENENLKDRVAYVLNNPVRQGIVDDWTEYPYKGSIGVDLEDVIS